MDCGVGGDAQGAGDCAGCDGRSALPDGESGDAFRAGDSDDSQRESDWSAGPGEPAAELFYAGSCADAFDSDREPGGFPGECAAVRESGEGRGAAGGRAASGET